MKEIPLEGMVSFKNHSIIEVSGREHREWLHRISSNACFEAKEKEVIPSAFLNANAGCIAFFLMMSFKDKMWILANPYNRESILDYLEQSHFGEDILYEEKYPISYFFHPDSSGIKNWVLLDGIYSLPGEHGFGSLHFSFEKEITFDLPTLSFDDLNRYLLRKGFPISGLDINKEQMILEAPLREYVSDAKGCYPGQEVIAKVFTYGRVAKKLIAAELDSTQKIQQGEGVFYKAELCGKVLRVLRSDDKLLLWLEVTRAFLEKSKELGVNLKLAGSDLQLISH